MFEINVFEEKENKYVRRLVSVGELVYGENMCTDMQR